jgi:two-component system, NarL family, response regulator NreC
VSSPENVPIRILVVDDHPAVRRILCRLLQEQPDFTLVGEAETGAQAILRAKELRPDVVLVDISLPDMNGLDVAKKLKEVAPSAEILVVSDYNEGEIEKAFVAGARGYLLKSDAGVELAAAIRTVNKKEQYLSSKLRSSQ